MAVVGEGCRNQLWQWLEKDVVINYGSGWRRMSKTSAWSLRARIGSVSVGTYTMLEPAGMDLNFFFTELPWCSVRVFGLVFLCRLSNAD